MRILSRLRERRLRYAVTLAAVVALAGSLMGCEKASVALSPPAAIFDLDHGNALSQIIYPALNTPGPRAEYAGRPGSWVIDHAMLIEITWFDAIAPYEPTAVGIFSDLGRRPAAERTARNRNIAVIYSAFTSLNALFPQFRPLWLEMMTVAGLDPNNTAEDPTTPSGIGILAAKNAMAARSHDGTNRDGDEGGRQYNRQPYADYTGYQPVNTAHELRDPSRWQPTMASKGSVFAVQEFATPQFGRVKPFSYDKPEQFRLAPPATNYDLNRKGYQAQADEVLKASAGLDDRQKMIAELFNESLKSFGIIAHQIIDHYSTRDAVIYVATTDVASFDIGIASWYFMRKYDSVRPFSAIRQLYGAKKLTAWGGPGKGTVSDITGNDWRSYLSTIAIPSPEYPSVNAAVCLGYAQVARHYHGTDNLETFLPIAKGSSLVEPGVTPAKDLTLHYSRISDWASDCGQSRVWAGENFPASVEAASQYAPKIADLAYDFVQRKLNGR